ncbi:hypothetical protein YC2023_058103 [Brassica napus]
MTFSRILTALARYRESLPDTYLFTTSAQLTSHKYPANVPISNRRTSRTNLLKLLETATTRIRKFPQPQTSATANSTAAFEPVRP